MDATRLHLGQMSEQVGEHLVRATDQTAGAGEQEAPRRRSTIREPAAFSSENGSSSPANLLPPKTVVSSSGTDEQTAPKRGWWAKRLLGDKS